MRSIGKSALEIFADRLSSLAPLDEQDVRNILALSGRIGQARSNSDVVTPGQAVDHVCLVVEGLLGRFGQLAMAPGRSLRSTFPAMWPTCTRSQPHAPPLGSRR